MVGEGTTGGARKVTDSGSCRVVGFASIFVAVLFLVQRRTQDRAQQNASAWNLLWTVHWFYTSGLSLCACIRTSRRYEAKRRKGESLVGWCPTALVLNFPIEYKSQQSYSITQNGLIWHTVDGLAGNSGLGSAFVTTSPDKPLKKSETRGVFGVRMLSPCILCSILT